MAGNRVKIIADENIPFLRGVLEPFARVEYLPGIEIRRKHLLEADGLIIRTRTQCNADLLSGTTVHFIATATIGYEHIDTAYCDSHGISWHHAWGCNASGVHQYMAAALVNMAYSHHFHLENTILGIIGVGNIGTRILHLGELFGMKVLQNDPPRERKEGKGPFVPITTILHNADIITLHVPLTFEGEDRTFHLVNEEFLDKTRRKPLLINTSRGEVADGAALKKWLDKDHLRACVLDVWEKEPDLDKDLLSLIDIGTPHIAGYSTEGKANGTSLCVQQASKYFGFGIDDWYPESLPTPAKTRVNIETEGKTTEAILREAISVSYDIWEDASKFRERPDLFEKFRNEYPVRREFQSFTIHLIHRHPEAERILKGLGFKVTY